MNRGRASIGLLYFVFIFSRDLAIRRAKQDRDQRPQPYRPFFPFLRVAPPLPFPPTLTSSLVLPCIPSPETSFPGPGLLLPAPLRRFLFCPNEEGFWASWAW
jgi:hypothetical protein